MIILKIGIKSGDFKTLQQEEMKSLIKTLTKLSIENLLHPFQNFILGQKAFPPKIALKYKIPLVFYGENEAEHHNAIADNQKAFKR